MTVLLPVLIVALSMNPKLASMQPRAQSVPLVAVQLVTNRVRWTDPPPPPPVISNLIRAVQIGTTQTNWLVLPKTNQAAVAGPAGMLALTAFSMGTNGLLSGPSNTITNNPPAPLPPQTNVVTVTPLVSTSLNGPWAPWTNAGPWSVTNPAGQMYFKFGIAEKAL